MGRWSQGAFLWFMMYLFPAVVIGIDTKRLRVKDGRWLIIVILGLFASWFGLLFYALMRKSIKQGVIVKEAMDELSADLDDIKVSRFITVIQGYNIPNKPGSWNSMRAAYSLIKADQNVSSDIKNKLRVVMQSKGVSGLH